MRRYATAITIALIALPAWTSHSPQQQLNQRPVAPLGDNQIEDNLQEVFNRVSSGPTINAAGAQISTSLFRSDGCMISVVVRVTDLSRLAMAGQFGLYSAIDPLNRVVIQRGQSGPGTWAAVAFGGNGDVTVNGVLAATGFTEGFGFFMTNTETGTFYSEDYRNPGGRAQALIYRGNNSTQLQIAGVTEIFTQDKYIVAFEDRALGSGDGDYQDLVVLMTSLAPAGALANSLTLLHETTAVPRANCPAARHTAAPSIRH